MQRVLVLLFYWEPCCCFWDTSPSTLVCLIVRHLHRVQLIEATAYDRGEGYMNVFFLCFFSFITGVGKSTVYI
jgi:hypothetical protein